MIKMVVRYAEDIHSTRNHVPFLVQDKILDSSRIFLLALFHHQVLLPNLVDMQYYYKD